MDLEDRFVSATPEGVSLSTVLAGPGSRFAAYLIDLLIQLPVFYVVYLVAVFVATGGGETAQLLAEGAVVLFFLLDFIGYPVVCEMFWSGRTVGKRANGLRVVRVGRRSRGVLGEPAAQRPAAHRHDPVPRLRGGRGAGPRHHRNQRLGDLGVARW